MLFLLLFYTKSKNSGIFSRDRAETDGGYEKFINGMRPFFEWSIMLSYQIGGGRHMYGLWKLRQMDKASVSSPLLLRLWNGSRIFKVQAALEAEEMFTFVSVIFVVVVYFSVFVSSVVLWNWLTAGVVAYSLVVIGYVYNTIRSLHFQYMFDCMKLNALFPNPGKATEGELRDFAQHFLIGRAGEILKREKAQHGNTLTVDIGIGLLRTVSFKYFELFTRLGIVSEEYGYYFDEAQGQFKLHVETGNSDPYTLQGNCGLVPRAQPAA